MSQPHSKCPDCSGEMKEIRIVDLAGYLGARALKYTSPGVKKSFWTGMFKTEGDVDSYSCVDCGRIFLYRNSRYQAD